MEATLPICAYFSSAWCHRQLGPLRTRMHAARRGRAPCTMWTAACTWAALPAGCARGAGASASPAAAPSTACSRPGAQPAQACRPRRAATCSAARSPAACGRARAATSSPMARAWTPCTWPAHPGAPPHRRKQPAAGHDMSALYARHRLRSGARPPAATAGHHVMSQSGMSARPSRSGVYVAAAAPEGGRGVLCSGAAQLPRLVMAEEEP